MKPLNVMIVGVGGQGTLLASRLLGAVLLDAGYDVKLSEVHGMSQRGGSVVTYVRGGEAVRSPLIEIGEADYIIAFEALEAARFLPYLKEGGTVIANTQEIMPMPVITGAAQYPNQLLEQIAQKVALRSLDALALAKQAGNAKSVNIVLMGVLSTLLDADEAAWQRALKAVVKPQYLSINQAAFAAGRAVQL